MSRMKRHFFTACTNQIDLFLRAFFNRSDWHGLVPFPPSPPSTTVYKHSCPINYLVTSSGGTTHLQILQHVRKVSACIASRIIWIMRAAIMAFTSFTIHFERKNNIFHRRGGLCV